jgi:hypothetical protein
MKRPRSKEEIANWWFSDEDLAEAVANIVDVPQRRKWEPSKSPATTHKTVKGDRNTHGEQSK